MGSSKKVFQKKQQKNNEISKDSKPEFRKKKLKTVDMKHKKTKDIVSENPKKKNKFSKGAYSNNDTRSNSTMNNSDSSKKIKNIPMDVNAEQLNKKGKHKLKRQKVTDNNKEQNPVSETYIKKLKKKKKLKLENARMAADSDLQNISTQINSNKQKSRGVEEKNSDLNDSIINKQTTKRKKTKPKKRRLFGNEDDQPAAAKTKFCPNADKFLLISLIKKVLKKKGEAMSVSNLQKKVLKKFSKIKGSEETAEIERLFHKSLHLTYGVQVLDDTVNLTVRK